MSVETGNSEPNASSPSRPAAGFVIGVARCPEGQKRAILRIATGRVLLSRSSPGGDESNARPDDDEARSAPGAADESLSSLSAGPTSLMPALLTDRFDLALADGVTRRTSYQVCNQLIQTGIGGSPASHRGFCLLIDDLLSASCGNCAAMDDIRSRSKPHCACPAVRRVGDLSRGGGARRGPCRAAGTAGFRGQLSSQ